jgi:hypothetical protein
MAILRIGREAVMGGLFAMLMGFLFNTLQIQALTRWNATILFFLGLSFVIAGIGINLLRPWGRYIGVLSAAVLLAWAGFYLAQAVLSGRIIDAVNILPSICVLGAAEILFKLVTQPAPAIFSSGFLDKVRQAIASGQPSTAKLRIGDWVFLVLLVAAVILFIVLSIR